jgi:catechol 2,3-dioxygenase-like lactoylglutathione lyase family enzyme
MDQILTLRPFVPARDFDRSKAFYHALGFRLSLEDDSIAVFKLESFSFILQRYYQQDFAENCAIQLLVRDATAWWTRVDADALVAEYAVKPPRPPAVQPWGLKVGFLFDPSGVLWHIAESPF